MSAVLIAPLVIASLWARRQSLSFRLDLSQIILDIYWHDPIIPLLGTGLNNSSAVLEEARDLLSTSFHGHAGGIAHQSIHSQYLIVLTDTESSALYCSLLSLGELS
jgi:hypothetical protein